MRLFLGLRGAGLVTDELNEMCRAIKPLEPHQPSDRHMTLCFIGDCTALQAKALMHGVDGLMATEDLPEVLWRASSINTFPENKPKAWALTGPMTDSLSELITKLKGVHLMGNYIDMTRFKPHVSLVYVNRDVKAKTGIQSEIRLDELVLYRSLSQTERLSKSHNPPWAKTRYEPLKVWGLKGKTGLP